VCRRDFSLDHRSRVAHCVSKAVRVPPEELPAGSRPAGFLLVGWRSATLIGRLRRRLDALGLLCGGGLALLLPLSILR
jgi:hypothetical protein